MNQRYPFVDFAKGFAMCTILGYHALQRVTLPPLAQQAIHFGGTGVHLFFLLSGFGLALSAQKGFDLWAFYRRRMVKIWIPYVWALTLSLVAALWLHLFPDGLRAWLAGVGLYQMVQEQHIQSFGGHFWYISTILQLYAVFPLLWWLLQRWQQRPWLFPAVCLGISVTWWVLVWQLGKGDFRTWNSNFLQFLWEFGLGMSLALAPLRIRVPVWAYFPLGLFFSGIMIVMLLKMGETGRIFNDIPGMLGYSLICLSVFEFTRKYLPAAQRFFEWTGQLSFALYLIHVLVLELCLYLMQQLTGVSFAAWWLVLFFPLAYIAAQEFKNATET